MFTQIERPTERPPGVGGIISAFGFLYASNGFIGWLFAVTGPVAIILAVGSSGGLSESEIASWIFGVFFFNGVITLLFSGLYRQPLVFFWTIPGTVLVGQSLTHLTFPEVVGAFYATGLLMLVLGASGWVKRGVMQFVPMPIVMGMVAGVFLRFGLELVRAVFADTIIAGPMVAIWLILSAIPRLGRRFPPIIGALVVGASMTVLFGRFDATATLQFELIRPVIQTPVWSLAAMIELVVPLAITVLVVQNGQGFAVLGAAGAYAADQRRDHGLRHRLGNQCRRRWRQFLPDGADQRHCGLERRARTPIQRRHVCWLSGAGVRTRFAGADIHTVAAGFAPNPW